MFGPWVTLRLSDERNRAAIERMECCARCTARRFAAQAKSAPADSAAARSECAAVISAGWAPSSTRAIHPAATDFIRASSRRTNNDRHAVHAGRGESIANEPFLGARPRKRYRLRRRSPVVGDGQVGCERTGMGRLEGDRDGAGGPGSQRGAAGGGSLRE
jgi:hypothetical protein